MGCGKLKLYWIGGEILCLGPDSVINGLEAASAVFNADGIVVEHCLQSNLLLYDSNMWKDVLSAFGSHRLSSSLDFPNLYRQSSSLSVEEYNHAWLEKKEVAERDGFKVSVISMPNPETIRRGAEDFYRFFVEEARTKTLQVNFPFPGWNIGLKALDLEALAFFMVDLYGIWVASGRDIDLSPFSAIEGGILGTGGRSQCVFSYSCARDIVAIGPEGEVGQCDWSITTFRDLSFGSLFKDSIESIMHSPNRKLFWNRPIKLVQESECGECLFWKICHGGCPVRAFTFGSPICSPDHYCAVHKAMFSAVLQKAREGGQIALTARERS